MSPWRPLRIWKIYHPIPLCDLHLTCRTRVDLTTTAHLKNLSLHPTLRPAPHMPHLCRPDDHCAFENFFTLSHCATYTQHAARVAPWQAELYRSIILHLIMLKRTNMLHPCRSDNSAQSWHLLHHLIVRIITNMPHSCRPYDHCTFENCWPHPTVRPTPNMPHPCRLDKRSSIVQFFTPSYCALNQQQAAPLLP